MSSRTFISDDGTLLDDRTTKARIRDAAIGCFAEHGINGTTARKVATAAGVSAGLVIHHFGSMGGLRAACDGYVTAVIRQQKLEAISAGASLDVLAALRDSDVGSLGGYLARMLVDDSPEVAKLVDELVADAEIYLEQGVEAGTLEPTGDPRGRAAVLIIWSLGALVLHQHLERILGVDLTDPEVGASPAIASYAGPVYEILGKGIFTKSSAANLKQAFAGIDSKPASTEQGTSHTEATSPSIQSTSEGST